MTPTQLVPTKSDKETAEEVKAEVATHLNAACEVITRARRSGLIVQFQISVDAMHRSFISSLAVMKEL